MTVKQLIDELNRLVSDPESGVTLETNVYPETLSVPETLKKVYAHRLAEDYADNPDAGRIVVFLDNESDTGY